MGNRYESMVCLQLCLQCGRLHRTLRFNREYCSDACRMAAVYEARGGPGRWNKHCFQCGQDFVSKRSTAQYCSDKCRIDSWRATERAEAWLAGKRSGWHSIICVECGQGRMVPLRSRALYCCDACKQRAYRKRLAAGVLAPSL